MVRATWHLTIPFRRWGDQFDAQAGAVALAMVKRAPVWCPNREQTGLEIFRRDGLIHDRMPGNGGERGRDLVVAVRDGAGQRVCFTGVCGGIAENNRCGSTDIASVDKGKAAGPHGSCKTSFAHDVLQLCPHLFDLRVQDRHLLRLAIVDNSAKTF
jgi:hypothetical protein